jgi:hypothetical protein
LERYLVLPAARDDILPQSEIRYALLAVLTAGCHA